MSFWIFYLFALLPLLIGGVWFILDKEINWIEWVAGSVVAFVIAGIFHIVATRGMLDDIETWSGQIVQARHYAAWEEYYQEAIYRTEVYTTTSTDSKGRTTIHLHTRQVFDHWEDRTRWHNDKYVCRSNIDTNYGINKGMFDFICKQFADHHAIEGKRHTSEHNSRMISGDPNDYIADNKTGWVLPITDKRHFENRIKAAPSTFSFVKPPQNIKVYPYPSNNDPWRSDRLMGSATLLNPLAFDQMNSRLGPSKKVNVIMIGMGDVDSFYGQWQEAAYVRGRKNDIVICWGGLNTKPTWVKVFSWGEGVALKNIQSLILEKGVTNSIFDDIEREIRTGFTRADWKKFNYISIEVATKYLWWYLGVMAVIQTVFWFFARNNQFDKLGDKTYRYFSSSYQNYRNR